MDGIIVLLLIICYLMMSCTADDISTYNIRSLLPDIHVSMINNSSNKITITEAHSSTTSIEIKWKLLTKFNGTHRDTVVGYIAGNSNGRFISDRLGAVTDEFQFKGLQPDTRYDVCVEMLELLPQDKTISHFKCVEMRTLATIRIDSMIAMFITMGYLIFMGIVGCIVWRHRVIVNNRTRLQEDVDENSTIRWKDIEEKQCLNSIEDSVHV